MNTTAKERYEVIARLEKLGIDYQTAQQLRRISLTLQRWFELECGTGDEHVTLSVEREGENGEGKPFMRRQYQGPNGWIDNRYPIADRETGARKRLARIMADFPKLTYYVRQTLAAVRSTFSASRTWKALDKLTGLKASTLAALRFTDL